MATICSASSSRCLRKPYQQAELVAALRDVLGEPPAAS